MNDPWQVQLQPGFASEHAWVTRAELGEYLKDPQLLQLAEQML